MGFSFYYNTLGYFRVSLDCILRLGKKGHSIIKRTGTGVSVEVHAKSGSRGVDLVRFGPFDMSDLIAC